MGIGFWDIFMAQHLWLLSICLDLIDDKKAIFHFIGYWRGKKIRKIYVVSQKSHFWLQGACYFIKLEVHSINDHLQVLEGLELESKLMDEVSYWF